MIARSVLKASLIALLAQQPLKTGAALPSAEEQPPSAVIVELFTSEGCSSCPPADALLRQVNFKRTVDGQLVIAISEHVTYWNQLGWRDPYSAQTFTDRQEMYSSRFSGEGPYTPQMVVNGRESFVGSNGETLSHALHDEAGRDHLGLQILSSTITGQDLSFRFAVTGMPAKPQDIIAIVTDDADRSNVLHGENSGRSLEHVSVARVMTRVTTIARDTTQDAHIAIPERLHITPGSGHHLILFAQEQHQGAILGASVTAL